MHVAKVSPYEPSAEEEEERGGSSGMGRSADLVSILIDLTYYKSPELVSAALGLLVRQFEQRKVLEQAARKVPKPPQAASLSCWKDASKTAPHARDTHTVPS